MQILDPVRNLIKLTVVGSYNETADIIEIENSSELPDVTAEGEYDLVWYNYTEYKDPSDDPNVEIIRVTEDLSNNQKRILRGQQGTNATDKNTPNRVYKVLLAPLKKLRDDIEEALQRYELDFDSTDWVLNGEYYEIQITHDLNSPFAMAKIEENGNNIYATTTKINENEMIMKVPREPDLRFTGRVIVLK